MAAQSRSDAQRKDRVLTAAGQGHVAAGLHEAVQIDRPVPWPILDQNQAGQQLGRHSPKEWSECRVLGTFDTDLEASIEKVPASSRIAASGLHATRTSATSESAGPPLASRVLPLSRSSMTSVILPSRSATAIGSTVTLALALIITLKRSRSTMPGCGSIARTRARAPLRLAT